MESAVDSSFLLPSGDELRVFLSQETVTVAMLRKILRSRGIFISSNEKKNMLDHVLLSFLSPDEFDHLIEETKTKEESKKFRTRSYTVLPTIANLGEALPDSIDFHQVVNDEYGNWVALGTPTLTRDYIGNKQSFVISYQIERRNAGADWIRARKVFSAEIRYSLNPESHKIEVTAIHTSNETEQANRMFIAHVKSELRKKNILGSDLEEKVTFGSFLNDQRMLFLMKFTAFAEQNGLSFERLTDLALKLDDSLEVPEAERLSWADSIDKILFTGKALQDTIFVKDKTTWEYLLVWKMEAKFKFVTPDYSGHFTAVFEFADYSSSKIASSEFQVSVFGLSSKDVSAHSVKASALTKQFTSTLNNAKEQFFKDALAYSPLRNAVKIGGKN